MQQNSTPKSALAWGSDRSIFKKLMRLLDLYLVLQKLFPCQGEVCKVFPLLSRELHLVVYPANSAKILFGRRIMLFFIG